MRRQINLDLLDKLLLNGFEDGLLEVVLGCVGHLVLQVAADLVGRGVTPEKRRR